MRERKRSRGLLVALAVTALTLITLDYRQGPSGPVGAVQRGAIAVFAPVAEGFATVARPVGGFFSSIAELGSLRERNAALEVENEQLRQQQVSAADLVQENEELRRALDMRERLAFTTTGATVIAQPPNSLERTVFIDAGANEGLLPGMAVINGDGLVGKLTEVTRTNARVELLTSPSAQYAVRIADSGESGLLTGQGANPFQLEVLKPEVEVRPGAEVVTKLFAGTAIPDGIPVGVVEGRRGASRFLSVKPFVDFTSLNNVQVVLDFPTQPSELPSDELVEPQEPPRPEPPDEVTEP